MLNQQIQSIGASCRAKIREKKVQLRSRLKQLFFAALVVFVLGTCGALFWNVGWISALLFTGIATTLAAFVYQLAPNMKKQANKQKISAAVEDNRIDMAIQDSPQETLQPGFSKPEMIQEAKVLRFNGVDYRVDLGQVRAEHSQTFKKDSPLHTFRSKS